jgi:hypothetical protein
MPTEDELRDLLRNEIAPNRLDAKRVVSASRRRRIPQQIAAGGVGALAIAGIAVFGIQTTQFGQGGTVDTASAPYISEDGADQSQPEEGGQAIKLMAAERINLCEAPVADVVPSAFGLQLDVVAPLAAPVGTGPVEATVRMTNAGPEAVTGTTASAPVLTVSQAGIVLWHSNGPVDASAVVVDLEPGASMEYVTTFTPVRCSADDDELEQFRPDLPALPAGQYDLSAVVYFSSDAPTPTTELDLVSGPRAPVVLQ